MSKEIDRIKNTLPTVLENAKNVIVITSKNKKGIFCRVKFLLQVQLELTQVKIRSRSKSFLCRLGIHKWRRSHYLSASLSNGKDYKKKCQRCGELKRWTKAKYYD